MLGHDHALSGALAFAAVAPLLHVNGAHLAAAAALTAGVAVLPDIDEPGSTIARTFGFLTGAFAWVVHIISGGHRKGTHSLLGVAVMTVAALVAGSWQAGAHPWWRLAPAGLLLALLFSAGLRALQIGGHHGDAIGIALAALMIWKGWDLVLVTPWRVPVLAVCVALGMLAHIAGDMCTHDGCPLLYPLSRHEFGLLPQPVRITTSKLAERWIVSPLLLAGLVYFLWRNEALHVHLAGRLPVKARPGGPWLVAGLAIGYAEGTGKPSSDVLFPGQAALPPLVQHAATYTARTTSRRAPPTLRTRYPPSGWTGTWSGSTPGGTRCGRRLSPAEGPGRDPARRGADRPPGGGSGVGGHVGRLVEALEGLGPARHRRGQPRPPDRATGPLPSRHGTSIADQNPLPW